MYTHGTFKIKSEYFRVNNVCVVCRFQKAMTSPQKKKVIQFRHRASFRYYKNRLCTYIRSLSLSRSCVCVLIPGSLSIQSGRPEISLVDWGRPAKELLVGVEISQVSPSAI